MGGWDAYTEKMEKEGCYKAAVCGHNGKMWSHSKGFKLKAEEVVHFVQIAHGGSFEPLHHRGFSLYGKSYAFIRGEFNFEDSFDVTWFIGRHKERGKVSEGIIVACTEKAILIGLYNPAYTPKSFGNALLRLSRMAQLMIQQGY